MSPKMKLEVTKDQFRPLNDRFLKRTVEGNIRITGCPPGVVFENEQLEKMWAGVRESGIAVPFIMHGYCRQSSRFDISPDGLTLDFQFVDVQIGYSSDDDDPPYTVVMGK